MSAGQGHFGESSARGGGNQPGGTAWGSSGSGGFSGVNEFNSSSGNLSSFLTLPPITRSTAYSSVPKITEGMSFLDYKQKVSVWRRLICDSIPSEKMGLLLLGELPTKDKYGGLQSIVIDNLGVDLLARPEGVDTLLNFLEKRLMEPSFVRLCRWMDKFESFEQKSSWNPERLITEFNKLIYQARTEFDLVLPPVMKAAKLVRSCQDIPDEQVGMLTSSLELGHSDVHEKAENMIRQYIQNKTGFAKKDCNNLVKMTSTDILGNVISDDESEEPDETFYQLNLNKKFKTKKDHEKLRKVAEKKGFCSWCYGKDHKREACSKRKKDLESKKRKVLESGKVWFNGDGTVTNPDGSVSAAPDKKQRTDHNEANPVKFAMASDVDPKECLFDVDTYDVKVAIEEISMPENVKYAEFSQVLLTNKTKDKAIIDTGCAKAVAGSGWVRNQKTSILPEDQKYVRMEKSSSKFRFGDGLVYKSKGRHIRPIYIGGQRKFIIFDEVDCDIPLLISLELVKRMDLQIRFKHDFAQLPGGPKFKLILDKGHYWMSVDKESSLKDIVEEDLVEDVECQAEEHNEDTEERSDADFVKMVHEVMTATVFDEGRVNQQLEKLHIQMAHPPKERFVSRLKLGRAWKEEMGLQVDKIYLKCKSKNCRARKETQAVRKVAFRHSQSLGDLVAVDLKIRSRGGRKDILYMMDHATSFIVASFIENKKPETIATAIVNSWFGRSLPFIKTLLSDNGSEFVASPMIEVLELLNIRHEVTAGFTPQQNGSVERAHAIVDMNMEMLMEASSISEDEALNMAVNAYNQMEMKSGVSPAFLVYNVSTIFPALANLSPPQSENVGEDLPKSLGDVIKAREAAMKNHLEIRMSDKLRLAIRSKTRPTPDPKEVGEVVYFKRANDDRWRGPGIVSDSIQGQVSVKMGRYYYPCRHADLLRLTESEQKEFTRRKPESRNKDEVQTVMGEDDDESGTDITEDNKSSKTQIEMEFVSAVGQRTSESSHNENDSSSETSDPDHADAVPELSEHDMPETNSAPTQEIDAGASCSTTDDKSSPDAKDANNPADDNPITKDVIVTESSGIVESPSETSSAASSSIDDSRSTKSLTKGDVIELKIDEPGDNWIESKIISRCRKGAKRKGDWFNCEINKRRKVINLEPGTFIWRRKEEEILASDCVIQDAEVHEVYSVRVPWNQHHLPHVVKAKTKELNTLKEFNTFTEVREDRLSEEQKENVIGSLWIVVNKELLGETVCKARICCRGDMEKIEIKTDSPTVAKASERILLTTAASNKWKLQSLDFKAAFLQGRDIDREVIVIPPKDVLQHDDGKRVLWKLQKSMYGLVDASRNFNKQLDKDLLEAGCIRSTFDKALYFFYEGTELIGILAAHVDDINFAGTPKFHKDVIAKVVKKYTVGRIESGSFNFTGWNLRQDSDGIVLTVTLIIA